MLIWSDEIIDRKQSGLRCSLLVSVVYFAYIANNKDTSQIKHQITSTLLHVKHP